MKMDYNKTYNKILTDEEFMEIKQHGSKIWLIFTEREIYIER